MRILCSFQGARLDTLGFSVCFHAAEAAGAAAIVPASALTRRGRSCPNAAEAAGAATASPATALARRGRSLEGIVVVRCRPCAAQCILS